MEIFQYSDNWTAPGNQGNTLVVMIRSWIRKRKCWKLKCHQVQTLSIFSVWWSKTFTKTQSHECKDSVHAYSWSGLNFVPLSEWCRESIQRKWESSLAYTSQPGIARRDSCNQRNMVSGMKEASLESESWSFLWAVCPSSTQMVSLMADFQT